MAEKITLLDSLVITVFSMAVVFAVLASISFLIRILKAVSNGGEKKEAKNQIQGNLNVKPVSNIKEKEAVEDEELVAVISAAIAASLGVSIPEVRIRTIRRVNQNTTSWVQANKIEQVMKRL